MMTTVRAGTTASIDLSSTLTSLDGVTLADGDRVLVKDQTTQRQNGVYAYSSATQQLTRAPELDSGSELAGTVACISEGTSNANTNWQCTSDASIVVDSVNGDPVIFAKLTGYVDKQRLDSLYANLLTGEISLSDSSQTLTVAGGHRYVIATVSVARTLTLGSSGASTGDTITVRRTSTSGYLLSLVNGGPAGGTLQVLTSPSIAIARFNGTDWIAETRSEIVHNVMDYGADNTGATSASPAILAAYQAAILSSDRPVVYFPKGKYKLTQAIQIQHDNVTLMGAGMDATILWEDESNPSVEYAFIPILVQKGEETATGPVSGVTVRDLTVEFANAGPYNSYSGGGIQLNHVINAHVERCRVLGNGTGMNNSQTNGITVAYASEGATIIGCVVDGVSKSGFYAAKGKAIRFVSCVSRNNKCTLFVDGKEIDGNGWSVGSADDVIIEGCQAYGNEGAGVFIATLDNSDPPERTLVLGGIFANNGTHGIVVGTSDSGFVVPPSVKIEGVLLAGNGDNQISISGAFDFEVNDAMIIGSGSGPHYGVMCSDIPASSLRTRRGAFRNCTIRGHADGGYLLRSVDDITIEGGSCYSNGGGLHIVRYDVSRPCTNIRVVDVDWKDTATPVYASSTEPATSGYFRIQSRALGAPTALQAPKGSEYTDLASGKRYHKASGYDSTGWQEVLVDAAADTSPTPSTIARRDATADLYADDFVSSQGGKFRAASGQACLDSPVGYAAFSHNGSKKFGVEGGTHVKSWVTQIQFAKDVTPIFNQETADPNVAPVHFRILAQQPNGASQGASGNGGDLKLLSSDKATNGTAAGQLRLGTDTVEDIVRITLVNGQRAIGFYGASPVVRPAAYTQTYSTADRTLNAYAADDESTAYTGAADGEAKLADLNALRVAYENLRHFTEDLAQLVNAMLDDDQLIGLKQ